jgi:hypothetical protein
MTYKRDKPTDSTPHEEWAWREAEFCERMVSTMQETAKKWLEQSEHSESHMGALKCTISAECWDQMARHLRMPIYSRIENDQYKKEMYYDQSN